MADRATAGLAPAVGPTQPVGRRWVAALAAANLAAFLAWFGPLQVLLAQQAESIRPDDKEALLGLVTGVGAFVSLVCNPVWGAFSDRTVSRFGRRAPWVVLGALVGSGGLLVLAGAHTAGLMLLGWCLVQAGANASFAAVMAAIPDRVPHEQRGVVGGWVALAQTVGGMAGTAVALVTGSWEAGYVACAVCYVLLSAPYVLGRHDRPYLTPAEPFRLRAYVARFWLSPRRHPDFAWAWVTRFLVQLGNALGLVYLYYFLDDAVGYDDPEGGVFVLTVVYSVCTILTAVYFGRLSDRVGRRRVFVSVSGVSLAVATCVLALIPPWPVAVAAAAALGLGFGVFTAVDYALMTEVLPDYADSGRDLGIINIAAALPQVLAPAVAAPLVRSAGGYPALYVLAAGVTLAGAVLVRRIRGVA